MEREPHVPAFKSQLGVHREYSSDLDGAFLYKFKDRDDLIVRPLDWTHFLKKGYFRPKWEGNDISAEEFAHITKQHFDELVSYGIAVPVSFVVADKERESGTPVEEVFAIVENIQRNKHPDKKELGQAFAELRANLLRYYGDKFEQNESFLADLFKDTQYVYGKMEEDPSDRLYLVDVEPFIYSGPKAMLNVLIEVNRIVEEERAFFSAPEYGEICEGFRLLYGRVDSSLKNL